jgi:hypothetical protein
VEEQPPRLQVYLSLEVDLQSRTALSAVTKKRHDPGEDQPMLKPNQIHGFDGEMVPVENDVQTSGSRDQIDWLDPVEWRGLLS